jgi:hypothetical protein
MQELSCCYVERFSLCFFLFSALSFLVIGFFLELFPIPNLITVSRYLKHGMKLSVCNALAFMQGLYVQPRQWRYMESIDEIADKAASYFRSGYNCAESMHA